MGLELEQILDLVLLAGEVLLRNGAETCRVEETVEHMGRASGAQKVEAFVIPTGVIVTIADQEGHSVTAMRRIRNRTINLDRVAKVNELSRRISDGRMTGSEAMAILKRIARERTGLSLFPSMVASGILGATFAALQQATMSEQLLTFFIASFVRYIAHVVSMLQGVRFTFEFLGAIAAAALATLAVSIWPNLSKDAMIVGGIVPLVPGVAITNAIRDVIGGDFLSGTVRGLEALLTSVAVAMGVTLVLAWG